MVNFAFTSCKAYQRHVYKHLLPGADGPGMYGTLSAKPDWHGSFVEDDTSGSASRLLGLPLIKKKYYKIVIL